MGKKEISVEHSQTPGSYIIWILNFGKVYTFIQVSWFFCFVINRTTEPLVILKQPADSSSKEYDLTCAAISYLIHAFARAWKNSYIWETIWSEHLDRLFLSTYEFSPLPCDVLYV